MGEGEQRNSKRTAIVDPRELARLAKQSAERDPRPDDEEELLARRAARGSEPPLTGRTVTLDDPLTTSLLAEVARQARTVELSPAQLDAALERAALEDDDESSPAQAAAPTAKDRR